MGLLSGLGSAIGGGLNLLSTAFVKPIETAKTVSSFVVNPTVSNAQKVNTLVESVSSRSATSNIISTVKTTAIAAATILPATKIVSAVSKSAGTIIAANPIKTAAVGLIATPILAGSGRVREAVVQTPFSVANVGSNIAQVIETPTLSNIKEIYTDNPVVATGLTLAAVGGAALLTAKTISPILQTSAINEQTQAIETQTKVIKSSDLSTMSKQEIENLPKDTLVSFSHSPAEPAQVSSAPSVAEPLSKPVKKKSAKKTTKKKKKSIKTKKTKKTKKKKKKGK